MSSSIIYTIGGTLPESKVAALTEQLVEASLSHEWGSWAVLNEDDVRGAHGDVLEAMDDQCKYPEKDELTEFLMDHNLTFRFLATWDGEEGADVGYWAPGMTEIEFREGVEGEAVLRESAIRGFLEGPDPLGALREWLRSTETPVPAFRIVPE